MEQSLSTLECACSCLPVDLLEHEVLLRVHKTQMQPVFKQMISSVHQLNQARLQASRYKLQDVYQDITWKGATVAPMTVQNLRHDILYYSGHDVSAAKEWSSEDDDRYMVYEDLPLLVDQE